MQQAKWFGRLALLVGGILFAMIILLAVPMVRSRFPADAQAADVRFDHIYIVSAVYLFKGAQGVLVLDKRNGNVWFIARGRDFSTITYDNPELVTRIPFEKLDTVP